MKGSCWNVPDPLSTLWFECHVNVMKWALKRMKSVYSGHFDPDAVGFVMSPVFLTSSDLIHLHHFFYNYKANKTTASIWSIWCYTNECDFWPPVNKHQRFRKRLKNRFSMRKRLYLWKVILKPLLKNQCETASYPQLTGLPVLVGLIYYHDDTIMLVVNNYHDKCQINIYLKFEGLIYFLKNEIEENRWWLVD